MNARNEYIIRWNNYLISMYGQQVWSRFWRKISEKDTFFQNRLKTTDTMPIEKFLLFMHDVVRFFFDDHTSAYKVIGARDAELALTDSVNVQMLHSRPFERFAEHLFPFLWRKQFDYG
ncbi:MAG: hypothetical protein JW795_12045, partial [Chitinivibrionales bacterium]|nr:hypothetical protein [Chitinivibrionales bacterium]